MKNTIKSKFEKRAHILKALAHPTRLFIVETLSKGERCVCELKELLDVDFSTISKHLLVLKNAGIVSDTKRGLNVFYTLKCPCVLNFISCVEDVMKTSFREDKKALKA